MTKKTLLILILLTSIVSAQQVKDSTSSESRFSFIGKLGNYTQQIEDNKDHLTNESSYSVGIIAEYRLLGNNSIETGFYQIDKISFSGLTYDSYKIPLVFNTGIIFNGNESIQNTKIVASIGVYLRSITNLDNNTNIDYEKNSVFGFHASLGVEHNLSDRAFVNLSVKTDRDFSDILEAEISSIRIKSSYGLFLGFGLRL